MSEFRIDDPGKLDRAGQSEKQLAARVAGQGRHAADDVQAGVRAMSGDNWAGGLGKALSDGESEWGKKLDHVRKSLEATGSNLVTTAENFRKSDGDAAALMQRMNSETNSTWEQKQPTVLPDFI